MAHCSPLRLLPLGWPAHSSSFLASHLGHPPVAHCSSLQLGGSSPRLTAPPSHPPAPPPLAHCSALAPPPGSLQVALHVQVRSVSCLFRIANLGVFFVETCVTHALHMRYMPPKNGRNPETAEYQKRPKRPKTAGEYAPHSPPMGNTRESEYILFISQEWTSLGHGAPM